MECSFAMIANRFSRLARFLFERKATSVVACVYWRFTRWSVTICATKLASVLRRLDVVSTAPWVHAESSD